MGNFIVGFLLGSLLTGSLGLAGNLYDSKGNVQAPRGSQQQFDYFRQRQQWLDLNAMRRNQEEQMRHNPCAK